MNALETYFQNVPAEHSQIVTELRKMFLNSDLGVTESYKWSRPVYGCPKDFAYIKYAKKHVTLGFYDASILNDPMGKLEGEGLKMKHLKIKYWSEVDQNEIAHWILVSAKAAK